MRNLKTEFESDNFLLINHGSRPFVFSIRTISYYFFLDKSLQGKVMFCSFLAVYKSNGCGHVELFCKFDFVFFIFFDPLPKQQFSEW